MYTYSKAVSSERSSRKEGPCVLRFLYNVFLFCLFYSRIFHTYEAIYVFNNCRGHIPFIYAY